MSDENILVVAEFDQLDLVRIDRTDPIYPRLILIYLLLAAALSSSRRARASFRSAVSNPSLNQR
jgi:hypothetical protein